MQGFNSSTDSQQQELIFDTLPPLLAILANKLFPDSAPSVVLLPLTDLEKELTSLSQWLHAGELEQLEGYTYPKRRQEWLAGRICAKQALRTSLRQSGEAPFIPAHNQFRVAAKESGQPYFAQFPGVTFPFPQLSITHSKSFAAALTSSSHCGIDIQYPAESLGRVKERFCTAAEEHLILEALPRLAPLSTLALLWTGKEAIKKMLSPQAIPGFHEIQLQHVTLAGNGATSLQFRVPDHLQNTIAVAAQILKNGYGLAFCCQQSNS